MTSNEHSIWVEQELSRQVVLSENECVRLGSQLLTASSIRVEVSTENLPLLQVRANEQVAQGVTTNMINARRLLPGMALALLFEPHANVDRRYIRPPARHISLQRLLYLQCIDMRDDTPQFRVGADYASCYDTRGTRLNSQQAAYAPDNRAINRLLARGQFVSHIGRTSGADGVLSYGRPVYWTQGNSTDSTVSLSHTERQDRVEAVFVQASPLMHALRMVVGPP